MKYFIVSGYEVLSLPADMTREEALHLANRIGCFAEVEGEIPRVREHSGLAALPDNRAQIVRVVHSPADQIPAPCGETGYTRENLEGLTPVGMLGNSHVYVHQGVIFVDVLPRDDGSMRSLLVRVAIKTGSKWVTIEECLPSGEDGLHAVKWPPTWRFSRGVRPVLMVGGEKAPLHHNYA